MNLDSLEEEILEYSLQGLSYSMMSDRIMNYDLSYISNIKAPKLFRKLRQFTGLDINKKNCKLTIQKILTSDQPQVFQKITGNLSHINLREAPDFNDFYGRTIELDKLHQWIIKQHSRLVGIFGLTGIGKTALVRELVENIKDDFDYVIWKNMEFSSDWEQFITHLESCFGYHSSEISPYPRILNLIDYLKNHRCLLIFDQWEVVMGDTTSSENYNKLLSQIGNLQHQSCLLFTGLQKPTIIDSIRNKNKIRQLSLSGLDNKDARILLEKLKLQDPGIDTLIRNYKGHPLALILVSENIKSVHNGKIEKVLDSTLFLDDVLMDLLENQIYSLPSLQQNIIKKLATEKEPETIFEIYQYFPDSSQAEISAAINNLWKVGVMEKDDMLEEIILWVINPLIQKYIRRRCR
ncbi:hypothetical protein H6F32_12990 [Anabaena sp. FACHB-1237]|uniref:NB-ARC domain-containing protein n=1 Tax=Anabaena sp. FACHB-1237 TaxID=2692769 RepID=UPI00168004AA|nr:NB-ARC domain-containing protein [Anabaena sp. FACHB-1237]MBD2138485.1 hypothetical protein [Anabaena sp. FACHB-1237]